MIADAFLKGILS